MLVPLVVQWLYTTSTQQTSLANMPKHATEMSATKRRRKNANMPRERPSQRYDPSMTGKHRRIRRPNNARGRIMCPNNVQIRNERALNVQITLMARNTGLETRLLTPQKSGLHSIMPLRTKTTVMQQKDGAKEGSKKIKEKSQKKIIRRNQAGIKGRNQGGISWFRTRRLSSSKPRRTRTACLSR